MKDRILMPCIPLRGLSIFPRTILHFDIGREKSIKALETAMNGDKLLFVTSQKDENILIPTPDAYSLPVATQTTLGGIKAGNGDNFSSGAEGTTKNYKAKVEVDNDGLATVNLQHLVHDSDQADHSLGWGIEAGYTYIDVVRLSTDKLVQGTNTLIINGGGAEW